MELLKWGIILYVTFMFGGYHLDDQVKVPYALPRFHRIRLTNKNLLKAFFVFRDKNQRRSFLSAAVILQSVAYITAISDFILGLIISNTRTVNMIYDANLWVLGIAEIWAIFTVIFYKAKGRK